MTPVLPDRFYGPGVFQKVFDRFDIGTGDRFYDSPAAYTGAWGDCASQVRASLLVTLASRGELGTVRYVIERRNGAFDSWERETEKITTQRDFIALITILE